MTTMTPTPALLDDNGPAYYAGRADAYDDHRGGTTPEELTVRLGYLIDQHPDTAYVTGYAARVWEIHAETRHLVAVDTYWEKKPRLRGRALLDAKTVTEAESTHRRRLGISQAAWDKATTT
ncbi:hypothetical protein ACTOXX_34125 [Streptomyces rubiginosohelvolus]|uniref:hypothetical protein n=1 Tax=Streptomyces rubiginosohelvolus TaxID=67362 RepID=UPI003F8F3312